MTATVHPLPNVPEFMAPALLPPVGGPISQHTADARADFDQLQADQREAWRFAIANQIAVLTIAGDRNGAYMVIVPSEKVYTLFGDECAMWKHKVVRGLRTEHWIGTIPLAGERGHHVRVFWREVKCVAH